MIRKKNPAIAINSQVCEVKLNVQPQTPNALKKFKKERIYKSFKRLKTKDILLCYVVFDMFTKELCNFMAPLFPPHFQCICSPLPHPVLREFYRAFFFFLVFFC